MSDKLSRDEILTMKAGEALNVLIAERVMGWRWDAAWDCYIPPEQIARPDEMWTGWKEDINSDTGELSLYREPIREHHVSGIVYNGTTTRIIMPDWSTDIAAAWQVVGKMQGSDYSISIAQNNDGYGWGVDFDTTDFRGFIVQCFSANAPTVELAICRAALLATLEDET